MPYHNLQVTSSSIRLCACKSHPGSCILDYWSYQFLRFVSLFQSLPSQYILKVIQSYFLVIHFFTTVSQSLIILENNVPVKWDHSVRQSSRIYYLQNNQYNSNLKFFPELCSHFFALFFNCAFLKMFFCQYCIKLFHFPYGYLNLRISFCLFRIF